MYVFYDTDSSDISVDWKVIYVFTAAWVLVNEKNQEMVLLVRESTANI